MNRDPIRFLTIRCLGDNNRDAHAMAVTNQGTTSIAVKAAVDSHAHFHLTYPILVSISDDDTGAELTVMAELHPTEGGRSIVLITSLGDEE